MTDSLLRTCACGIKSYYSRASVSAGDFRSISSLWRVLTHFGPGSVVFAFGLHGYISSRLKRQRIGRVWELANLGGGGGGGGNTKYVQHPAIAIINT